ncbi:hypothetical protein E2C01_078968 [Portunus trituberculatus]|uniref:Uncharacterized protein n=1 Tax=Portunus trituberculatus TaxID=210409 RepID=A0A5B7IQ57_PORTR|nr:hypothetical protein [Portunus trituberculatus]
MELENLNKTLAEGQVTWCARNQESVIDYILVNGRMCEIVDSMWIDKDEMISRSITCWCWNVSSMEEKERVERKGRKWTLRDVGWANFQVDLSERSLEDEQLNGVDELNDRFVENVKNTAASQTRYVRTGARKCSCKP